jgi:DNA-binding transcriptional ArsR family regulator
MSLMTEATLFKALGDPLRIKIVTKLSSGSTYTLGEITGGLGITRQAARKQVAVLVDARIVCLKPQGREVKVSLNANSLELGKKFISKIEAQWDGRLARFKNFVEGN